MIGEFLYLSVLALVTLYFNFSLEYIPWVLVFKGNNDFMTSIFKHFLANLKFNFSLLLSRDSIFKNFRACL